MIEKFKNQSLETTWTRKRKIQEPWQHKFSRFHLGTKKVNLVCKLFSWDNVLLCLFIFVVGYEKRNWYQCMTNFSKLRTSTNIVYMWKQGKTCSTVGILFFFTRIVSIPSLSPLFILNNTQTYVLLVKIDGWHTKKHFEHLFGTLFW